MGRVMCTSCFCDDHQDDSHGMTLNFSDGTSQLVSKGMAIELVSAE